VLAAGSLVSQVITALFPSTFVATTLLIAGGAQSIAAVFSIVTSWSPQAEASRYCTETVSPSVTEILPSPLVPGSPVVGSAPLKRPVPVGLSRSVTVSAAGSTEEDTVTVFVPAPARSLSSRVTSTVLSQP
jgi:hypothetical protein